jgi:adenylate cyclase
VEEPVRYHFASFVLDTDRRELSRAGIPVSTEPKVFDLLVYLIENRDRVVSKDSLIAAIWGDRIVADSALTTCINSARAALGDTGTRQQLIKTVLRKGWRFVANIQQVGMTAPHTRALPITEPPVVSSKPSIVVLPLINLSGAADQEHIADGITDDIITELSRFGELFVIARNSSFQYRARSVDVRQIGRELGVRYVLEGGLRRSDERLRINVRLVDTKTGGQIWSERYERGLADVFAVQDEIVKAIVSVLVVQLTQAEIERVSQSAPTSWVAYDYLMQGNGQQLKFLATYKKDDLYLARSCFEHALAIDGGYAPAHVGLSFTHSLAWMHNLDSDYLNRAALERAHEVARRAIHFNPRLPKARAELGFCELWKRNYRAALDGFQYAVSLNPNFCDWRYAAALTLDGQFEATIRVIQDYMRRDPLYPAMAIGWLGIALHMQGRYREALKPLLEFRDRAPGHRGAHSQLAAVYARLGMGDEARQELAALLKIDPQHRIGHHIRALQPYRLQEHNEHLWEGLRMAGLPD